MRRAANASKPKAKLKSEADLKRLFQWIHEKEYAWSRSFGKDISTPEARRNAWWHFQLTDHAFLRVWWTNLYEIAPGVWRSNQPSQKRLAEHKAAGFKSVLNLRGEDIYSYYLFEKEACDALGLTLIDIRTQARDLIAVEDYLKLFEIFDRIEKPFVMHCKSGADRAGLASALWMLDQEGATLEEAREMLTFKYLHRKDTRTGLMDHVLDTYEAEANGRPIRQWFAESYDPAAITASFEAQRTQNKRAKTS